MAVIKFHERNKAIFGKIESVPGTYQTGIAATDVIAATEVTGSITYETEAYQYLGSALDRDEISYLKDSYADVAITTPQQVLNVLNPALAVADVPLSKYLRACGLAVSVDGGTGVVTCTNATAEGSTLSFNFDKTSVNDAVKAKRFQFFNMLGMVDISAEIGKIPTLKFMFKGNAFEPVTGPILTPNFGNQTTAVVREVRQSTIVNAEITPFGENFDALTVVSGTPTITRTGTTANVSLTAHGLVVGQKIRVRGATGADKDFYNGDFLVASRTNDAFTYTMVGTPSGSATGTLSVSKGGWAKSFCFSTLQAPNAAGRDLERILTGCEEGFDGTAVPTDVNVTMLEAHTPAYQVTSISRTGAVATVVTATPHGATTGNSFTMKNATDPLYNVTGLITVINPTTFTYQMGGTPVGATAVAKEGSTLLAINNELTAFDPDLEARKFFAVRLKFGDGIGKYITYSWNKIQLTNVRDGKVGSSEGRDVTFRNTGSFTITYS